MTDQPTSHTCLVITAHADDDAIWCGGQMIKWAEQGYRVIVVRATNDENDSIGLSREHTQRINEQQFEDAARILGVSEVVNLGFRAESLTDPDRLRLRDALIHLYRSFRPYRTISFDPYSVIFEDNQDHLTVAKAADEAFWMAMCDKYVPTDLEAGLALHGVYERWYFGRRVAEVTDWLDIGDVIEKKVDAAAAHQEMLRNTLLQWELQTATGGIAVPLVERAAGGNLREFAEHLIKSAARAAGAQHGCVYAEEFRVNRFLATSDDQGGPVDTASTAATALTAPESGGAA